ncbi:MAG: ATP-binding protein [Bryobacteraceae bacterium]
MRVLILAPVGRDASLLASTLTVADTQATIAGGMSELLAMLVEGVGTVIVAEEALSSESIGQIETWLGVQPPWSDIPFIVLTSGGRPTRDSNRRALELQRLGNLTLIERPVRPETVQSSVRASLRARMKQYEIRSRQGALLQANADLEQFAHSASHDLREPLRSIGIYGDLINKEYGHLLDEKGVKFLSLIRSSARRMDMLLTDLLSYAHASSFPDETVDRVDVTGPLAEALENLSGAIEESAAEITIGEMPTVRMRESHLAQVFQNLISNAIKYRSDSTQLLITVSSSHVAGEWILSVADNGIGVPAAYKETIFGIFKRLHPASKYSGTGMGLAICQRIVERYRGRIWVESQPGEGSTFLFSVPS